jgi:hypothetical protein
MLSTHGFYTIEFCNLMTKLDGTSDTFASHVTNIKLQLSKKLVTIGVADANDGSTFRFIKTLETDGEWLLRVNILQPNMDPSYSLRFYDMKIKKHEVELGETLTQSYGFGLADPHLTVVHMLQLEFGTYDIEDEWLTK